MKNYFLSMLIGLVLFPVYSMAQPNENRAVDEKAIRTVVQNIEKAWAEGDGKKFADCFANDVDYTVWNGFYFHGREANIKGHQRIFDTIYKGTKIKIEIRKIRFLAENIATVHSQGKMLRDGKRVANVPTVFPLLVFKKESGLWKVAVFQNTPEIKQGELTVKRKN